MRLQRCASPSIPWSKRLTFRRPGQRQPNRPGPERARRSRNTPPSQRASADKPAPLTAKRVTALDVAGPASRSASLRRTDTTPRRCVQQAWMLPVGNSEPPRRRPTSFPSHRQTRTSSLCQSNRCDFRKNGFLTGQRPLRTTARSCLAATSTGLTGPPDGRRASLGDAPHRRESSFIL